MSLDETRQAAAEILDGTTGDLVGDDAQRFQQLTRHAEQLREQQRQAADFSRDLVRRHKAGQLRTERGDGSNADPYMGADTRQGTSDFIPRPTSTEGQRLAFDASMAAALTRSIAGRQ